MHPRKIQLEKTFEEKRIVLRIYRTENRILKSYKLRNKQFMTGTIKIVYRKMLKNIFVLGQILLRRGKVQIGVNRKSKKGSIYSFYASIDYERYSLASNTKYSKIRWLLNFESDNIWGWNVGVNKTHYPENASSSKSSIGTQNAGYIFENQEFKYLDMAENLSWWYNMKNIFLKIEFGKRCS